MIRLVHQFDDPRTRPSAAAPKSDSGGDAPCCCCCCCCIVTIIAASLLTARSMGRNFPARPSLVTHESEREDPHASERPTRRLHFGWRVFGFFFLPLTLVACGFALKNGIGFVPPLFFLVAMLTLYRGLGVHPAILATLIIGIPALSVVEMLIWLGFG